MFYHFFWVIPRRLNFMFRRFGTLCSIFKGHLNKNLLLKIEQIDCFETSAQKIQTQGNHPNEIIEQALYSPTEPQIFYFRTHSLLILANNQLDALFHIFIYFIYLHVSSITVLIIRRSNCINTSSGMISLCK